MPFTFPDPVLADNGIVLRHLSASDEGWIVAACSDGELSRYIPTIPHPYSGSDARAYIGHATSGWADGTSATFAIAAAATGEGLGTIELSLYADDPGLTQIGYWLRREARGRGTATVSVRLVSAWAMDSLGTQRLTLVTAPGNVASQRVAERAGFTREGLLRAWMRTPGGRRDCVMFSLLPEDRSARPA